MIEVSGITKEFGRFTAVADLSFSVAKGEVLGFLGPNGAGKTTTMRILTGFLPATRGTAIVAGHDIDLGAGLHLQQGMARDVVRVGMARQ